MSKKVCLLHNHEVEALRERNIRPDCSSGVHAHIPKSEAADMLLADSIEFINHYFAPNGTFARRKKGSASHRTAPTLKQSEVMANAGVLGASRTLRMSAYRKEQREKQGLQTEDFVERSMAKVALWPVIADEKAVRVGPAPDLAAIERLRL